MRVIGGEFRSRRLKSPPGADTRPTPDRLRETLFDVLAPRIAETMFLDAYAGSGAVGIEALSRGARRAIFIERSRGAVNIIRENLASLQIADRAEILAGKTLSVLARAPADIIFLDPPYSLEREYKEVLGLLGAGESCLVVAQHSVHLQLAGQYGHLEHTRTIRQSDNCLSFFEPG